MLLIQTPLTRKALASGYRANNCECSNTHLVQSFAADSLMRTALDSTSLTLRVLAASAEVRALEALLGG